jgi:hypothetical protein
MKKEVIIAIIIGIGIGLVITFGIKTAQQSLSKELQNPQPEVVSTTSEINAVPSHSLLLVSPRDLSIIAADEIDISGSTTPFSLIGIISNSDQNTVMSDMQGNFSTTLSLVPGVNIIKATSITNTGEQAVETRKIVQTDNNFDSATPSASATITPTVKAARI